MIRSTKGKLARAIVETGKPGKGFPSTLIQSAYRKLRVLDAATDLKDLRVPPSNHLEELKGNRKGQHSIRINKQWRIGFVWTEDGPQDVEIADYHKLSRPIVAATKDPSDA